MFLVLWEVHIRDIRLTFSSATYKILDFGMEIRCVLKFDLLMSLKTGKAEFETMRRYIDEQITG